MLGYQREKKTVKIKFTIFHSFKTVEYHFFTDKFLYFTGNHKCLINSNDYQFHKTKLSSKKFGKVTYFKKSCERKH